MTTISITNWDQRYENNRSRRVKDLDWVPVPNKHDGEGYARVMAHPRAAEIYTAFHLMLQVASRCHRRGSLVREGGRPHTPDSLALKTRSNPKWFNIAIEVLSNPEIGWITVSESPENEALVDTAHHDVTTMSPSCQSSDPKVTKKGREEKGSEGKDTNALVEVLELFATDDGTSSFQRQAEAVYDAYPRKVGKDAAIRAIKTQLVRHGLEKIITATKLFAETVKDAEMRFVPYPATWFNRGSFNDNPEEWKRNAAHSTNSRNSFDRNAGTLNAGHSSDYAGIGEV